MDEELRELEQAGQKTVSAVSKMMQYSEQILQPLLNATGGVLRFAGGKVKQANDIEKERHRAKKAAKGSGQATVSDKLKGSKSHLENFTFTGKQTDLCYFANTDRMPLSAIDNISDPDLRDQVIQTFNELCSKKKGCVKVEGDELVITDKGKKMLQDGAFRKQAMNDQLEAYGKQFEKMFGQAPAGHQQMCVALNGDGVHDFAFFTQSDNLNLNQILANPNGNLRDKIVANVKLWQQNGLVDIKDGMAKITDKGKELLKNHAEAFKEAGKDMTEKAVDGIRHTADSIIVTTKTAVKKAAEKTAEAAKTAAKTAARAFKFAKP